MKLEKLVAIDKWQTTKAITQSFYKQVVSKNLQNSDGITRVGSSIFFSFKKRIEQ